jgi:FKBP-type peptidyl-prolyl cis-trans isomerase
MLSFRVLLFAFLAFLPALAQAQREKLPDEDLQIVEKRWPNAQRTSTSLRTVLVKEGSGPLAQEGDLVAVLYTGRLLDGTIFDQTHYADHPFTFRLGRGLVIEGWEEGMQLMRVGEKRIFIIPYELGYGTRGDPPKVPRRATLVFDVELVAINPPEPTPTPAPTIPPTK